MFLISLCFSRCFQTQKKRENNYYSFCTEVVPSSVAAGCKRARFLHILHKPCLGLAESLQPIAWCSVHIHPSYPGNHRKKKSSMSRTFFTVLLWVQPVSLQLYRKTTCSLSKPISSNPGWETFAGCKMVLAVCYYYSLLWQTGHRLLHGSPFIMFETRKVIENYF